MQDSARKPLGPISDYILTLDFTCTLEVVKSICGCGWVVLCKLILVFSFGPNHALGLQLMGVDNTFLMLGMEVAEISRIVCNTIKIFQGDNNFKS
jgi:hypothetical protein